MKYKINNQKFDLYNIDTRLRNQLWEQKSNYIEYQLMYYLRDQLWEQLEDQLWEQLADRL